MAENSKIEWCDHTINFWWGCEKVSPACANCYAEAQDARFHPLDPGGDPESGDSRVLSQPHWGPYAPRLIRVEAARREAMRYERRAVKEARRFRVFTNSMSDFFEDRADLVEARQEALDVIMATPHLDWLILTKRPEKILPLLSEAQRRALGGDMGFAYTGPGTNALSEWLGWWLSGKPPANVWLGTTVEDQARADQRIPALLGVPAAVRFLSCEPLLGPIQFRWTPYAHQATGEDYRTYLERAGRVNQFEALRKLDWVIVGGESGPHARPMHPDWARGLRDQCAAAGVPFLFKQWGEFEDIGRHGPRPGDRAIWPDGDSAILRGGQFPASHGAAVMRKVGKVMAGRILDGREHNGFPEVAKTSA